MFGGPDWLPRTIVVLLAIGFVPALIFSWVFELTPQGLKRDAEVAPEQSIAPQTARRMDRMIIVVLALALGYFAVDKFLLTPGREAARVAHAAPNELKPVLNPKSIAVLPFENLSDDKQNAYFAEGVQDEILTYLAKIADLKVISRTSVMQYKGGTARNLREIGRAGRFACARRERAARWRESAGQRAADRCAHGWPLVGGEIRSAAGRCLRHPE